MDPFGGPPPEDRFAIFGLAGGAGGGDGSGGAFYPDAAAEDSIATGFGGSVPRAGADSEDDDDEDDDHEEDDDASLRPFAHSLDAHTHTDPLALGASSLQYRAPAPRPAFSPALSPSAAAAALSPPEQLQLLRVWSQPPPSISAAALASPAARILSWAPLLLLAAAYYSVLVLRASDEGVGFCAALAAAASLLVPAVAEVTAPYADYALAEGDDRSAAAAAVSAAAAAVSGSGSDSGGGDDGDDDGGSGGAGGFGGCGRGDDEQLIFSHALRAPSVPARCARAAARVGARVLAFLLSVLSYPRAAVWLQLPARAAAGSREGAALGRRAVLSAAATQAAAAAAARRRAAAVIAAAGPAGALPAFQWTQTVPTLTPEAAAAEAAAAEAAAAAAEAAAAAAVDAAAADDDDYGSAAACLPRAADVMLGRLPYRLVPLGPHTVSASAGAGAGAGSGAGAGAGAGGWAQQLLRLLAVARSTPLFPSLFHANSHQDTGSIASLGARRMRRRGLGVNKSQSQAAAAAAAATAALPPAATSLVSHATPHGAVSRPLFSALLVIFPLLVLYALALVRLLLPPVLLLLQWPGYAHVPAAVAATGPVGSRLPAAAAAALAAVTDAVAPHLRPLRLWYWTKSLILLLCTLPAAVVTLRYFGRAYDVDADDARAPALLSVAGTVVGTMGGVKGQSDGAHVERLPARPRAPKRLDLCLAGTVNVLVVVLGDLAVLRSLALTVTTGLFAVDAHTCWRAR